MNDMQKTKIILIAMVLALLTFLICFPIWVAVTGTFSAQWELVQNLSPVFLDTEGHAKWTLLPSAPHLAFGHLPQHQLWLDIFIRAIGLYVDG